jgi:quercetin dioxygenase-like cupin family protein
MLPSTTQQANPDNPSADLDETSPDGDGSKPRPRAGRGVTPSHLAVPARISDGGRLISRPRSVRGTASATGKEMQMSLSDPVLTGPKAGRTVNSGHGSSAELKIAGEQSGGDWAVVEWRIRAGDEPPIHTHTREDETVYVLDGAITAYVGGETIQVEAGSYAALPKNVPHGLTVRGEEARLLIGLEPAGAEYFLVPRDDSDADPGKFGLVIHEAAAAM